jgi:hypothetical protein
MPTLKCSSEDNANQSIQTSAEDFPSALFNATSRSPVDQVTIRNSLDGHYCKGCPPRPTRARMLAIPSHATVHARRAGGRRQRNRQDRHRCCAGQARKAPDPLTVPRRSWREPSPQLRPAIGRADQRGVGAFLLSLASRPRSPRLTQSVQAALPSPGCCVL